jgi:hypothetical protein
MGLEVEDRRAFNSRAPKKKLDRQRPSFPKTAANERPLYNHNPMAQSLGRPLLSAVRLPSFERRCFTQLAARRAAARERGPEFPGPRPEPSVRIASKELMDKIPDLGLLDGMCA